MSMLVVGVTAAAVLLAADSRQYPSGKDAVKKLFLVGKHAMLGHSGIGVIPSDNIREQGAWDAAKEVARIAGQVPAALPIDQFTFISKNALASLNDGLAKYSLLIDAQNPHLAIMFVDRDARGRVFFARKESKILSTHTGEKAWRHRAEAGETQVVLDRLHPNKGVGWDVPPQCPVGDRKPTAPTAAGLAAFINGVAGQSHFCTQMIGGTIRVAIIDSAGARWLQE